LPLIPPPALLNATSSRPNAPTVRSTSRVTASASVTSLGTAIACPPPETISPTVDSRASAVRAASATAAPASANIRAAAAPIPRLAPVMIAAFPASTGLVARFVLERAAPAIIVSASCGRG
jgi:hypothetical protein